MSESELEDIVKAGQTMMLPPEGLGVGRGSSSSTQALIGDYSSSFQGLNGGPMKTPLRTPLQENIIMQEARNQRAFRDMTPLAGKIRPLSTLLLYFNNYTIHVDGWCCASCSFYFMHSLSTHFAISHFLSLSLHLVYFHYLILLFFINLLIYLFIHFSSAGEDLPELYEGTGFQVSDPRSFYSYETYC